MKGKISCDKKHKSLQINCGYVTAVIVISEPCVGQADLIFLFMKAWKENIGIKSEMKNTEILLADESKVDARSFSVYVRHA